MYCQQETCIYSNIRRFITTSSWRPVYECYVDYVKLDTLLNDMVIQTLRLHWVGSVPTAAEYN